MRNPDQPHLLRALDPSSLVGPSWAQKAAGYSYSNILSWLIYPCAIMGETLLHRLRPEEGTDNVPSPRDTSPQQMWRRVLDRP